MAIDRQEARRRVRTITVWAAAGAAALTGGLAFGASRGDRVAQSTSRAPSAVDSQAPSRQQQQFPDDSQGFTPPSSSTAPPAGMSGGS